MVREKRPTKKSNSTEPKKRNKPRHNYEVKAKTPAQQKYLDSIETNVVTLCSGPAGSGKAQPLDSLILTPHGWMMMGQVKIGMDISTPDGKSAKVTGVFPQGEKDIYEIIFSDGSRVQCCLDHLWFTQTALDRDAKRKGSVKSTKEILKSLRYGSKRNHSIPMTKPVEFIEDNLKIDSYLLGLLIGDGCFRHNRVEISTSDEYIVDYCRSAYKDISLGKIKSHEYDYRFVKTIRSGAPNPLFTNLKELGLADKLSYEKFIPLKYKYCSSKNRIAILQGLMDSDGTVSSNGYDVTFSSTSYELATDVQFLVQSLGGKASINRRKTSYTNEGEKKGGRESFRLNISLPPEINPFRLPRKAERYAPRSKYKPTRYVDSIEFIGRKEAQCIRIDSEDHLYLTNDFVVTHNTLMAIGAAMRMYFSSEDYTRIIIVRPAVEACGESLGFLPGDANDKMRPFIEPILDNLRFFIKDEGYIGTLLEQRIIQVSPMAFMRGRTYNNCIVIFDEAQNATKKQMKLFLTRIGKNCKVIIEGDTTQSDIPGQREAENGLFDAMNKLDGCRNIGIARLAKKDIQRSQVVADILKRYETRADE